MHKVAHHIRHRLSATAQRSVTYVNESKHENC